MPYKDRNRQKEYQKQWIAKRREEWFSDKSCLWCGSTNNLELDHIDPTTKKTSSIWSWSKERRDIELLKCRVLCEKCHLKRSIQQFKEWYSYDPRGQCRMGHNLVETGKVGSDGKLQCRYCHHIANNLSRGYKIKSLEDWIAQREYLVNID